MVCRPEVSHRFGEGSRPAFGFVCVVGLVDGEVNAYLLCVFVAHRDRDLMSRWEIPFSEKPTLLCRE